MSNDFTAEKAEKEVKSQKRGFSCSQGKMEKEGNIKWEEIYV